MTNDGFGMWAAISRLDGTFIGRGGIAAIVLDDGTAAVEVGWALRSEHHGHGYATEIGRAGLAFGFEELGLERIISITLPNNTRSRGVMERIGLREEGACIWKGAHHVLYSISSTRDSDCGT